MASAFWGGVANSLAGSMQQNQARRQEKEDWEWKAQKTAELENQLRKSRVTKTQVFEKDGQFFAQGYNDAGEPVGQPVPAGPAQVQDYKNGKQERELGLRKAEAQIAEAEAGTNLRTKQTGLLDDEFGLQKRRVDIDEMQAGASARSSGAYADYQEELRKKAQWENDVLNSMTPDERKGHVMGTLKAGAGRRGASGAGGESTLDQQRVNALINDIAASADDENLPDQLREEVAELQAAGKSPSEIMEYLLTIQRSAQPDISNQMSRPIDNWKQQFR
jgi:hypothetical protein